MFRMVSIGAIFALTSIVVLVLSDTANAHRIRCGSSWELCAERGRGPGAAQGAPVQPAGTQKKVKQQQRVFVLHRLQRTSRIDADNRGFKVLQTHARCLCLVAFERRAGHPSQVFCFAVVG